MESPNRCAGHLRQFNRSHFRAVDRSARPVRGKNRRAPRLEDVRQTQQPFARAAGTGAAYGIKAKHAENPCNELAVEAAANQDYGAGSAKVESAGKHALVPEAVDLGSGLLPLAHWDNAWFADYIEAPGAANHVEQGPHDARNEGQHNALTPREFGAR
jgi:hypothetical protein